MKKVLSILVEDRVYIYFMIISVIGAFGAFIGEKHFKLKIEGATYHIILFVILFSIFIYNVNFYLKRTLLNQKDIGLLSFLLSSVIVLCNYCFFILMIGLLPDYILSLRINCSNAQGVFLTLNENILLGNIFLGIHQFSNEERNLNGFHKALDLYVKALVFDRDDNDWYSDDKLAKSKSILDNINEIEQNILVNCKYTFTFEKELKNSITQKLKTIKEFLYSFRSDSNPNWSEFNKFLSMTSSYLPETNEAINASKQLIKIVNANSNR